MAAETVHDPVCHMDIAPTAANGSSSYQGKQYSFCSAGCKLQFDANPAAALEAEAAHHREPAGAVAGSGQASHPRWKFWQR
jgi:P-type Cu+ transporter